MPIHGYPGGVITANPTAPTSSVATGVWTTEQQLAAVAAGNWPFTIPTQQISRSLRFNPADTAYLNRTLGSSNRRTFTFSTWVKRSLLTSNQFLFGCINTSGGVNQQFGISLQSNDTLNVFHFNSVDGTYFYQPTIAVFRDVSAWYHIVASIDTTQATNTNRCKLYVNGVEQVLDSPNYFSQNLQLFVNSGLNTGVGVQVGTGLGNSYYLGGYMAEVYFIDGQQLTPSSFGRTNTATGVWEPLAYTGTYGTNGFYLNFSDNSGTTSTTLGKDSSGNGNNWTPNNFSVTAGAGNDSLVDSPTSYGTDTGVGGEVRGNYCTWNPLSTGRTLSNGNLDYAGSASGVAKGTLGVSSGKWYWEILANGANSSAGVASVSLNPTTSYCGSTADSWCLFTSGDRYNNGAATSGYSTFTTNDIISIALDMDNGKVYWAKNGVWQGSSNPATGTNAGYTNLSGYTITPANGNNNTNDLGTANFGQRAFAYTAPSGFKALCTQNLPTPTIGATSTTQADDYFDVKLATGSNIGSATLGAFSSVLAWIKDRVNINNHQLLDSVRGTSGSDVLQSNTTSGTVSYSTPTGNSVGWVWKANGTGSSNTAGTITSTVSANTASGFSIVTYTGQEPTPGTIGHGLGTAPFMIITKNRSGTGNWAVYHKFMDASSPQAYYAQLNSTSARINATDIWNNTAPTSTVFSVGNAGTTNASGSSFVAYCFAPVAGYSAFGSYTGNGSADGPFVYTGFRPKWVMLKSATQAYKWYMLDAARNTYNVMNGRLFANASTEEVTTADILDFTSNGFKIRTTDAEANGSGQTIIYACFAESPFKYALAR